MAAPAPEFPANDSRFADGHREHARQARDAAALSAAVDVRQREHWLSVASHGDTGAFAALYDDVAPELHGLVLRMLGDAREAESLTERIFLEIWRSAGRFDARRGAALSWMVRVAHRMCVEHVRNDPHRRFQLTSSPGRHTAAGDEIDLVPMPPEVLPDPASHGSALSLAFADLDRNQRDAITLAYFTGHNHTEVCQILRIPSGAAKACLTRGLQGLRRSLSAAR